jgi:hypothetical protein
MLMGVHPGREAQSAKREGLGAKGAFEISTRRQERKGQGEEDKVLDKVRSC